MNPSHQADCLGSCLPTFHDLCSEGLDFPILNPSSTLEDLEGFSFNFTVTPMTAGGIIASEFERQRRLPGVLVLHNSNFVSLISRRSFLERLSQPYGIELFIKRPIQVFLSIVSIEQPLILSETERIDRATQLALQRSVSQIYEPILVKEMEGNLSIIDFQTLLLAQSQILSLQKEELAQQSQQIESLNNQLRWQASHDPLTQLINRRSFEQHLDSALHDLRSCPGSHVLCYLDLDRFKVVNDTCGHIAGDELLKQVSNLMRNGVRKTDIIGRLGGDEFALLLYNCKLECGLNLANLLRQKLEDLRFFWNNHVFRIGASIGLILMDNPFMDFKEALRIADNACYVAKNKGKNRIHVYQNNDREILKEQVTVNSLAKLQQAIDENRLCLYFQPLISLTSQASLGQFISQDIPGHHHNNSSHFSPSTLVSGYPIAACEILLRLKDEEGNILPPGPFIAAAERYKLMHQIDRWVLKYLFSYLEQASEQNSNKNLESLHPIYMVNISGETLRDEDFVFFLQSQIERCKFPSSLLCFEITETVAVTNVHQASSLIRRIRDLGCHFALDDFGSGMSSFTYLKHFAVDFLKIDAMFARDIATDAINLSIIKAIHEVGHSIGLQTIVEGVEDLSILPILKSLGIQYAQGYGIQRPRPLKAVTQKTVTHKRPKRSVSSIC